LRPVALGPFDYDNENYTTNLWVAEGFTSYFENKFMLRAGFKTPLETAQALATNIATVTNTPGSRVQSAAEASYDAWIKNYRPNENSGNTSISYYSKGEVIGTLMDLEIANATKGARSLDNVMHDMYEAYYKKLGRGYTDAEFKAMVEKISGISFTDFWKKYVNGTEPADYKKYFAFAGVDLKDENEGKNMPYLGVASKKVEGKMIVSSVSRNSAAWDAGLNFNDVLVSVEGLPIDSALERMSIISEHKVGDELTVTVKRDGVTKDLKVKLKPNPNIKLIATMREDATEAQLKVRKAVFN
jgi:predicted metalloprotease with PDZ domain